MTESNYSTDIDHSGGRGDEAGPAYREKPLPTGEVQGRFLLAEPVIEATRKSLLSIAVEGFPYSGHEGLVYWAGREIDGVTAFLSVVVPKSDHGPQRVMVEGPEVGRASRRMREHNLGLMAQVHSHPGSDARHSDGDDDLVLMPFEGMLSIVAPHYGRDVTSVGDLTVHQYQDERWVHCNAASVERAFNVAPTVIDIRDAS
jgi:proteasome lid subunit RPN8/RPN11